MKAIDFVVRDDAGALQRGSVAANVQTSTITAGFGQEISLNLRQIDLSGHSRDGANLTMVLADGRIVVIEGFFNDTGEPNRLFISADGYLNEVTFVETTDGSQGVQQATYVVAVIVGTYLVFAGAFTVGSIIAVGILTGRTLGPLTQLAGILARWGNVKAALDGLDAVAQAAQDTDATRCYLRAADPRGHFELRDVTFLYDADGGPVLDVAGLAILPGQRLAILGANGSGKSSLLKVLSGLYAPSTGRVLMDGTDMTQIAPRDLRRHIGYLGQDVRLFCGTLRDNLNLTMMERDDARLMAALDFAGLGAFVRGHHRGLDLEILDGGAGLSIGQRQSIGWARLWLQDPKICLLDEPTAALDQALETALVTRLQSWCAGRTVVIATHRAPILALVHRTLVLQCARLLVDGPRDAVMRHLDQTPAPLRAVT